MPAYKIDVETGNRYFGDTRSNVSIKLFDWHGHETNSIPLVPNRPEHAFWINYTESFTVNIEGLTGDIAAVEIFKDNSGRQPAWYLRTVKVTNLETNVSYPFGFYHWFSMRNGLNHRREYVGTVYWSCRDMSDSPIVNHHFITIIFHNEDAARSICNIVYPDIYILGNPESETCDGNTLYFITIGWFAHGAGQGQPMRCVINQQDDVMSVREHLNPEQYVDIYAPDFSYEKKAMPIMLLDEALNDEGKIVRAVMRTAACYSRYQQQHDDLPEFDSISFNPVTCASFVNTLFAKIGYSKRQREKASDMTGFDVGECTTLSMSYFSPPEA